MKKNLWVLLALSALIAMFVIAGCAPKPTPTPTPTPTATPTTPPADTKCPELVSTDVYKYYGDYCSECNPYDISTGEAIYIDCVSPYFKIVITFNENIDPLMSSCLYNPGNWYVEVTNPDRVDDDYLNTDDHGVEVLNVELNGKQVIVTAAVVEISTNLIWPDGPTVDPVEIPFAFCGLICSPTDAVAYRKLVNGIYDGFPYVGVWPTPKIADEVYWKLSSSCIVSDELGNFCCGYDGSDCCVEPICEECVEPCPLGSSTCL